MQSPFVDFDDIHHVVTTKRSGYMVVTMQVLRDLLDRGRLGVHVCAKISESIQAQGLAHFPRELPLNQMDYVWIYDPDSRVGQIIEAVASPSPAARSVVRSLAGKKDSKILDQVRGLVQLPQA